MEFYAAIINEKGEEERFHGPSMEKAVDNLLKKASLNGEYFNVAIVGTKKVFIPREKRFAWEIEVPIKDIPKVFNEFYNYRRIPLIMEIFYLYFYGLL